VLRLTAITQNNRNLHEDSNEMVRTGI
jgi:hypothetical protein